MFEGRTRLTARAPGTSDRVLGLGFLAGAFESGLLAAGALGLGSADAGFAGAAAAGGWDCHGLLGRDDGVALTECDFMVYNDLDQ